MVSTRDKRYQRFIERLVAARQRAGLSQKQAADRLGRSQSYVSRCETGERRVDVIEATEFAALYGVALDEILQRGD